MGWICSMGFSLGPAARVCSLTLLQRLHSSYCSTRQGPASSMVDGPAWGLATARMIGVMGMAWICSMGFPLGPAGRVCSGCTRGGMRGCCAAGAVGGRLW